MKIINLSTTCSKKSAPACNCLGQGCTTYRGCANTDVRATAVGIESQERKAS